jgi:uncharacterized protein YebE (UPF0316 family)
MEVLADDPGLLAIAIFVARILDVSLGTLRTILVFRGLRFLSATIGFFEVLIWLAAVAHVIRNLDTWYLALAYAGGFAMGNAVGIWIESKLAMGLELVRAISRDPEVQLAHRLRDDGVQVITLNGRGDDGEAVEVLFLVERRRRVGRLLKRIQSADPEAVCTTSDVKRHFVPSSLAPLPLRATARRK